MANKVKEESIEAQGRVKEALANTQFRIELDVGGECIAHIGREDAEALDQDRPRGPGDGRVVPVRPEPRPHHLPASADAGGRSGRRHPYESSPMSEKKKSKVRQVTDAVEDAASSVAHAAQAHVIQPVGEALGLAGDQKDGGRGEGRRGQEAVGRRPDDDPVGAGQGPGRREG